jgi:hypothetical protein
MCLATVHLQSLGRYGNTRFKVVRLNREAARSAGLVSIALNIRALGSWVRIPPRHMAKISALVLSCALRRTDPWSTKSYQKSKTIRNILQKGEDTVPVQHCNRGGEKLVPFGVPNKNMDLINTSVNTKCLQDTCYRYNSLVEFPPFPVQLFGD